MTQVGQARGIGVLRTGCV